MRRPTTNPSPWEIGIHPLMNNNRKYEGAFSCMKIKSSIRLIVLITGQISSYRFIESQKSYFSIKRSLSLSLSLSLCLCLSLSIYIYIYIYAASSLNKHIWLNWTDTCMSLYTILSLICSTLRVSRLTFWWIEFRKALYFPRDFREQIIKWQIQLTMEFLEFIIHSIVDFIKIKLYLIIVLSILYMIHKRICWLV